MTKTLMERDLGKCQRQQTGCLDFYLGQRHRRKKASGSREAKNLQFNPTCLVSMVGGEVSEGKEPSATSFISPMLP